MLKLINCFQEYMTFCKVLIILKNVVAVFKAVLKIHLFYAAFVTFLSKTAMTFS